MVINEKEQVAMSVTIKQNICYPTSTQSVETHPNRIVLPGILTARSQGKVRLMMSWHFTIYTGFEVCRAQEIWPPPTPHKPRVLVCFVPSPEFPAD